MIVLIIYFLCYLNVLSYSRTEIKAEGEKIFKLLDSGDYGGDDLNQSIIEGEGEVTLSIVAKINNLLSGSGKVERIEISYHHSQNNIRDEEENLICKVNGDLSLIKFDSLSRSFYRDLNSYKRKGNIFKIHKDVEEHDLGVNSTFILANKSDNEKNSFYFKSQNVFVDNRYSINIKKLNEKAKREFDIDGDISIVSSRDLYKFFIPIHIPKRAMQHNLRHKITFNIKIFYDNKVVNHVHDFVFGNRSSNLVGEKMIIISDSHDAEYQLCVKNSFDEYSNVLMRQSLHSPDMYMLNKLNKDRKIWCFELENSDVDNSYEVVTSDGDSIISTLSDGNGISLKKHLVKVYSVNNNGKGGENRVLISSVVIDLYIIDTDRYLAPVFNSYSPKYFECDGKKLGLKNRYKIESIDNNMNICLGNILLLNSDLNYKLIPKQKDLNILCSSLKNIPENRVDSNKYIFSDRDDVELKINKDDLSFDTSDMKIVETLSKEGKRKIILKGLKVTVGGREYIFKEEGEIVNDIWSDVHITYPDVINFKYKVTYKIRNWYFLEYNEDRSINIDYDIEISFKESVALFPIIKRKDGDKYVGYMNFVKREFYEKSENVYNFIIYEGDNSNATLKWKSNDLDNIPFDLDLTRDILSKIKYVNSENELSFCRQIDYSYGKVDSFYPDNDIEIEVDKRDVKVLFNEKKVGEINNEQFILLPISSEMYNPKPQYSNETSNINMIFNDSQFHSGSLDSPNIVDIWSNPNEFDDKKRALSTDDNWICTHRSFSISKQNFYINNIFFTKGKDNYSAKVSFEGVVIKKSPIFTKKDESIEEQISCNVKFINEDDMDKHVDSKVYRYNSTPLAIFNNSIINSDRSIPFKDSIKIPFQIKVVKNIKIAFSARAINKVSTHYCEGMTHSLSKEGLLRECDKNSKVEGYFLKLEEENDSFEKYIDKSTPIGFKLGYQIDALYNDKPSSYIKKIRYLVIDECLNRKEGEMDINQNILLRDSSKYLEKDRVLYNKIQIQNREIELEDEIDIGYSIESSKITPLSLMFSIDKDLFDVKFPYSLIAHKLSLYILPYEYCSGVWKRVKGKLKVDSRSQSNNNHEGVEIVEKIDMGTFKEENVLRREEPIFEHPKAELFIDNPKYLLAQSRTNIRAGFSYRYDEKYNNNEFTFENNVSYNSLNGENKRRLELFDNREGYTLNPGLYISYFAIYDSSKRKVLELNNDFMKELIELGYKDLDSLQIYRDNKYDFLSISFDRDSKKYILTCKDEKFKLHIFLRYFEDGTYLPYEIFLEDLYMHQSILGRKILFKMEGQMFVNSEFERDENRRELKVDRVETESTILITKIRGI